MTLDDLRARAAVNIRPQLLEGEYISVQDKYDTGDRVVLQPFTYMNLEDQKVNAAEYKWTITDKDDKMGYYACENDAGDTLLVEDRDIKGVIKQYIRNKDEQEIAL